MLTSLALWQSNDCPSASKATLMNMDLYFIWIHYERLHNHNKAKHNKTVCIFLGIYCTWIFSFASYRNSINIISTCFFLVFFVVWSGYLINILQWQWILHTIAAGQVKKNLVQICIKKQVIMEEQNKYHKFVWILWYMNCKYQRASYHNDVQPPAFCKNFC